MFPLATQYPQPITYNPQLLPSTDTLRADSSESIEAPEDQMDPTETVPGLSDQLFAEETIVEAELSDFKTTPDGYPLTPYWDSHEDEQKDLSYKYKLIDHVLVKLWRQGARNIVGGSIDHETNRVHAHYGNTLYVQWEVVEHPDGGMVKRIKRALGGVHWQMKGPFDLPPPSIQLIDMNSTEGHGIDPFTFLTREELPK